MSNLLNEDLKFVLFKEKTNQSARYYVVVVACVKYFEVKFFTRFYYSAITEKKTKVVFTL